jgi:molybdenum ABC transporter molybdate-binding protein
MLSMRGRQAQLARSWLLFLASLTLLAGLVTVWAWDPLHWFQPPVRPLVVYCAAGLRAPVKAAALAYQEAYGVEVQLQYGPSQTLLSGIEITRRGDLYIPGDESYLGLAREKGLLAETLPLGRMKPVLAVRKGNPHNLHTIADLLRTKVRLAQAKPEAAAVGKLARAALEKKDRWKDVEPLIIVSKGTVNDVANDVVIGSVDAGIVWDTTAREYPELEAVALPELDGVTAHVAVGVLDCCDQPASALRFARFLAARDRGLRHFQEAGFDTADGDPWSEEPVLNLFAGAMLRPAVEETIAAFERREGVTVRRIYNGCGILVAQMRASKEGPDAYFACDQSFMGQVHDLFLDPVTISSNQLVILVHKGNPPGIKSLEDLARPGVRVGIGHEKQCALGVLTQETLDQSGLRGRVMPNIKVQSPTGDMLVNQLRTGSLDAVVAYRSNAAEAGDELEAIRIDIPCAHALQPFAVGKDSPHKQLVGRLLAAIRSRQSRERFESLRFHWEAPRAPR